LTCDYVLRNHNIRLVDRRHEQADGDDAENQLAPVQRLPGCVLRGGDRAALRGWYPGGTIMVNSAHRDRQPGSSAMFTYSYINCLLACKQADPENVMDVELVSRLRGVIGRLARQLNETSTGEGLTPTQYSVLGLIRGRGPLGLAELTELEGLNPTMLSRVIRVLDEQGLIRRLPNPSDMRAARVEITPEGVRVHERVRERRTRVLSECLDQLPEETAQALLAAVPAMEALAEAVKSSPKPSRASR
jgi:DNA-binding MarR family transcriptional regulator